MMNCHALPIVTQKALYMTMMMLVTSVMRSSPAPPHRASSESKNPPSHLLFYLEVEKELIPQTTDLANRARGLLESQCDKLSKCLSDAESLPPIPILSDFPSQTALRIEKEKSKMLTKRLLKESYLSLYKLEKLLEMEQTDWQPLQDLVASMSRTRQEFKKELESYDKDVIERLDARTFRSLPKSKSRYLRSRSEKEYRLRLLYTTYTRLQKISHVLGYTVKLSWVTLENNEWFLT